MRFKYVCGECGNEVPAERVERRVPGSQAQVRVMPLVECTSCEQPMEREGYTPARREVSGDDR